jgi:hypothetical protein
VNPGISRRSDHREVPPALSSAVITSVGMAWTPDRREIAGEVSTFTLTSLTWPARSRASCSRAGLIVRHGPHYGARKSTRTGILAASATSPNVVSSASAIHGSGWWHLPHRGVPAAARTLTTRNYHTNSTANGIPPSRAHPRTPASARYRYGRHAAQPLKRTAPHTRQRKNS